MQPKSSYMRGVSTIFLLILSNVFMNLAWYGHLKFFPKGQHSAALWMIVLISWGMAFFEYCFQVPANRLGFVENGGPFSLVELKVMQEVITLVVFVLVSSLLFRNLQLGWNHVAGFVCLIGAVYFIFKN